MQILICNLRTSRGSGTKMMEMIGPSRKALSVFAILLSFIQVTTSDKSEDAPFTTSEEFPAIVAGSAFIVPSSTLQKVEPPSIDKDGIQSNVSASIGRTAYLRCKVKNLGHKSVSWVRHDDVSLISVGKLKYIKDDRFKIIHEDNNIEWVLAIRSLKKSDEGLYECQVNSNPTLRLTIYLNVVEPFTEILGGKDVFIDQHSALNLTCVVHAPEPPAHIFWIHDGQPALPSATISRSNGEGYTISSLWVPYASPQESGPYQCIPSNTGPASINVHVLDGESTDALQTSGLSTFMVCRNTLILIWFSVWTLIKIIV